jgi:iron complex outermembrane receptor protein
MNAGVRGVVSLVAVCVLSMPAYALEGSVSGTVRTSGGEPVPDAVIEVIGSPLQVKADGGGAFVAKLPAGEHRLLVSSPRFGSAITTVNVEPGAPATLHVRLSPVYYDQVVVSAGTESRAVSEVAQPIAVLSGERLDARQQPSLGATISREAGVSTTSFGPAVGRPILRGLGNDRVRILSNGTDVGDLSAGAPDHAVDCNTASAERIEILRGAATLLYGSSAGGGVVNVIDGRIPETPIDRAIAGSVSLGGGSVAEERRGEAQAGGTAGSITWNASAFHRQAGDYSIPGFATNGERDEHERRGILANSGMESDTGTAGASWIGTRGFFGAALSRTEATYGLPGHLELHAEDEETVEEEGPGPKIELQQTRAEVRGDLQRTGAFIEAVRVNLGISDYEHVEAEESEEFGQRNSQKSFEGRIELRHRDLGPVSGSVGLQLRNRDVAIVGEEAFVPPNTIENAAVFALEEIARTNHRWQAGVRYEAQTNEGDPDAAPRRSYRALSSSLGFVWTPAPAYSIGLSAARAVKFPSSEELYSLGPHLSTRSYEIGNADLDKEVNLDFDVSIRKLTGRVSGELNLFVNRFDNFIFQRWTGEELEGLPVLVYENADAVFRGAELRGNVLLAQRGERHLSLEVGVDSVRAELRGSGEPLPRIPPLEVGGGLRYEDGRAWMEVGVWHAARQARVAPNETPTDAYTSLNASFGLRVYTSRHAHDFILRGSNLNNAEIRSHTSFLKDLAPQPGRDIDLAYRLTF